MRQRIAIVYNEPLPSRYDSTGESKAVSGVLEAVEAVQNSLEELDYDVLHLPLTPPWEKAERELKSVSADLMFNLFEGFGGEPGTEALVAETLSTLSVPFTGCPASSIRLALDKAGAKVILQAHGILTPDFQLLNSKTTHLFRLGFPCIVKPRSEDASHGITAESVVSDLTSLEKQVATISTMYGGSVLVERFIEGREFNTTVMGNFMARVLPPSEIVYKLPTDMPRILTFIAKWEPESPYFKGTGIVCPAEVNPGDIKRITRLALDVFSLFECRGYARVDMRMDAERELNVIEVNPNPDISPSAGAVRQAAAAGMNYTQFIGKIVKLAREKENHSHENTLDAEKRPGCPSSVTARHSRI